MNMAHKQNSLNRRKFFNLAALGSLGAFILPILSKKGIAQEQQETGKPRTNIDEAKAYPRTPDSLPGKYPGKVVSVYHENCITGEEPDYQAANKMIEAAMLSLTGAATLKEAWLQFVTPGQVIGLKVNPVAGKMLATSHQVVRAIIEQMEMAGIPKSQIVIWDRREFELHETGFTPENYPGVQITGTEQKDKDGSFFDKDGLLYGEKMIDKNWYYWADVEEEYDAYTLPYMVNSGKYSYFSKICTQQVDKIINIPILKNAGSSVTLCMKNLAYGCVSNTGRLHKDLWSETCAEVCAFPPVRDKVVLNIVDGIRGCFNGGPAANPQFITNFKTVLVGTDPVAVDRIGYEIVLKKRIAEGIQTEDKPRAREFMIMSQELGLGIADLDRINLEKIEMV
jgi:uncharacterized protein (DUF362 family)